MKCAESDALRSTFPTLLGGLYHEGEAERMQTIDITSAPASLVSVKKQVEDADEQPALTVADHLPRNENAPLPPERELEAIVVGAGFTFDQFKFWAIESGNYVGINLSTWGDLPPDVSKRLVKSKTGLLKELANAKASAK